ncbi:PD-(D/E)XK nuclease family protein [Fontisphaera persica]|uniref:RecB family exonuclease n=1 Tax=Fontisphaera persica TaxID=2974023 RepID=UPI0024C0315D|nr:PD-(D/E)XK nuclease family protein [Fontisphaera persica]WCJ60703.1 PD-(D/E)XK nuclease family protein [Fontisphaera persica]
MIAVLDPVQVAARPEPNPTEELQKTVSASRLNCWLQCRLKFFFRYVLQLPRPPSAAMFVGSIAHQVLQQWNHGRWRKEPFQTEKFKAWFDSQWTEEQKTSKIKWDDDQADERASAWKTLEHYFLETPIKADERPEAVEVPVEADLSHHGLPRLIGILDLVRAGGTIVDFKVTGKTPDPEQAIHQHEIQLSCYGVLYRDATSRKEAGLELHHLVRTKTPKLIVTRIGPITQQQETRLFKVMESYVDGVGRQDFVPSPSFGCAGCEYFTECRRWS